MQQKYNWKVFIGLGILYIVWGSTYIGIRYAIDTIPTFLMAGSRNFLAGLLLYAWAKVFYKIPTPSVKEWITCSISGFLLLFIGNGGITLVEHWIPSGFVALIVACVPIWIVLLQWIIFKQKPPVGVMVGVVLGIIGVGLLMSNNLTLKGGEGLFGLGVAITLFTTFSWSSGVIFMKKKNLALSAIQISSMQQISGGFALLALSMVNGEMHEFHISQVSGISYLAFSYLVVFGSIIGFTIFGWLSKEANPTLVSTYSYVNPLVAVLLGWTMGGEPLNTEMLIAAFVIVSAVCIITITRKN